MRTQAIIIKKIPAGEYNQLITCYTKEFGKLTAIGKSSLKSNSKQAMHLDILSLVSFELVKGRMTPIITGAQEDSPYRHLKQNLPNLAAAYFFMEVMDKTVFDYQPDQRLWNFYITLLGDLNSGKSVNIPFFRDKQTELLGILGYNNKIELNSDSQGVISSLDILFEQISSRQFNSPKFLYRVVNFPVSADLVIAQ